MTGFLDRLAAIALGGAKPATAARLSLPSRFAKPVSAIGPAPEGLETVDEPARTPPPRTVVALAVEHPRERRVPAHEPIPGDQDMAAVGRRDERPPEALPTRAPSHPVELRAPEPGLNRPAKVGTPPSRPLADPGDVMPPAARISRASAGVAIAQPRPAPPQSPIVTPPRFSFAPPALVPETRAAPLREAIVAGRTTATRQERPVIHVTIDRVEVRAPASSKPAGEQRRARPQPTVSLSNYLRGS